DQHTGAALAGRVAPVDRERLTGDPLRPIRREVADRAGDVFGPPEALGRERRLARVVRPDGHEPERQAVDGHARTDELGREMVREPDRTGLRRAVERDAEPDADAPGFGGDGDDATPAALAHAVDDRLDAVDRAVEVELDEAIPVGEW